MKNEYFPFVSIVFPNWNGKDDTLECLNSLRKLDYLKDRLEIIISDNGSIDGSQKAIKEVFYKMKNEGWYALKLIKNKKNLGSCVARNKGIKNANKRYKYIWLMDNDIVVESRSLKELLRVAESSEEIGIVGSGIYYFNKPNEIWPRNGVINWKTFRFNNIDGNNIQNSKVLNVDYISGCSFIIKKEIIRKIGMYDPDYFCYYNEIDLCIKAKKAGYRICMVFPSKVWHKVASTTKKVIGFQTYFKTRNIILLIKKNFNFLRFIRFLMFIIVFDILLKALLTIFRKEISQLNYIYKGMKDGLILGSRVKFQKRAFWF